MLDDSRGEDKRVQQKASCQGRQPRAWASPPVGNERRSGSAIRVREEEGGDKTDTGSGRGGDGLEPVEQPNLRDEPVVVVIGEIVLSGAQVDATSSYPNLPELTGRAFVRRCVGGDDSGDGDCETSDSGKDLYFYRTGDLGYIDPTTGNLHVLGRIRGDGMVKINGVRIELAEIEGAIIDDDAPLAGGDGERGHGPRRGLHGRAGDRQCQQ